MTTKMEYKNVEIEVEQNLVEGVEVLLAEAVRKYPILYDKSDKYTKSPHFVENSNEAWKEISDELNLELESCQNLWTCTKQKFLKYRKKLDVQEPIHKEWPLYESLRQWLDKHIKKRRTRNLIFKQIRIQNSANLAQTSDESQHRPITPIATLIENEFGEQSQYLKCDQTTDDSKHSGMEDRSNPRIATYRNKRRPSFTPEPKKKLKMELIDNFDNNSYHTDTGNDIFSELDTNEMHQLNNLQSNDTVDVLQVIEKETTEKPSTSGNDATCRDVVLEANFDKLEQVIEKCVGLAEKCITKHSNQDSTEMFGKFVASMVRELPTEKRIKIQMDIIQYAGDLILKSKSKN